MGSEKGSQNRQEERGLTDKIRFDVISRDGGRCLFCGRRGGDGSGNLEIDHVVPWSWGGRTHEGNLATLCKRCNRGKRDRCVVPPSWTDGVQETTDGIWTVWVRWANDVSLLVSPTGNGACVEYTRIGYHIDIRRVWEDDWHEHLRYKQRNPLWGAAAATLSFAIDRVREILIRPPVTPEPGRR